jgi:tetratricopeptide (TPR) repeat protein
LINVKYIYKSLLIICLFSVIVPDVVFGQAQTNAELAAQYFSTGDYEKAVVYYEKFYDKDPFAAYPPFLRCLMSLKQYDKAEKLVKKQIKKFPSDFSVKADLGTIYELTNEKEKANKVYGDLIKSLSPDVNQINMLGSAFIQRQQYDLALQTYLQGKKLLKDTYPFNFELAEVYAQQGKMQEMINEYLDMINFQSGYLGNVQTILQNKLSNETTDTFADLLRTSLLRRIQKSPDEVEYSELLFWLFIQEKDFESAFVQARGIDKRLGESGERMLSLGKLCVNNLEYETAAKCFQYVVDKGPMYPLYINARMELINAVYSKVTGSGAYTTEDLLKLEQDYKKTIDEIGRSAATATLIRGYAHLEAFYLHKTDEAIDLLNETIALPQISPDFKAESKLELADIYVFTGNVWEAALLYGQVDKDFKNDAFGREAKFRNARLSYYLGEFSWAREQLNVLKSATSQLISNDAIALELLIMDNTNLDTSEAALLIFSRAELLTFQNKDSLALATLDSLLLQFPGHMLTDEAWYKKAFIYKKNGKFDLAIPLYAQIVEKYPDDILADDALFSEADIYENKLNNKDKAKELYETLITKYPGSLFVVDARKRFRILRGEKVN